MMLRIAQLANFVGPVTGGMRVAIDALGSGYTDAGHERLLICPGPRDTVTRQGSSTVATVASPRVSGQYRMVMKPWKALRLLEEFAPTSIEVSDKWTLTPAARWARRRGIGSVLFSHERLDDMASGFVRTRRGVVPAVRQLNRYLAGAYDDVVVTSGYARAEWASTNARLTMVPLGVDLDTFHPSRGKPGDDGRLKLIHVGRLSREKSPQLAIAAAVELHRQGVPVRLDVYGTGPHLAQMRTVAADAPVMFHGHVSSRTQLAERLAGADVSLSVCPTETFGLAVLEALACGTPVVTANRGGAAEIVDASCGGRAEPTPAALAAAVLELTARPRAQLRAAARARAEQFTWQRSIEAMLALHTNAARRRRPC